MARIRLYVIILDIFIIRIQGQIVTPRPSVTYGLTVHGEYLRFDDFFQSFRPDSDLARCGDYVYKKTIRYCYTDQSGIPHLKKCQNICGEYTMAGVKYCREQCPDYYSCSYGFQYRNQTFCGRYYDYTNGDDRQKATSPPEPPITQQDRMTTDQTTPTPISAVPSPSPETNADLLLTPTPLTVANGPTEAEPDTELKWIMNRWVTAKDFWPGTLGVIGLLILSLILNGFLIGRYCCRKCTYTKHPRSATQPGPAAPVSTVATAGQDVYTTATGQYQRVPQGTEEPTVNYSRQRSNSGIVSIQRPSPTCEENRNLLGQLTVEDNHVANEHHLQYYA